MMKLCQLLVQAGAILTSVRSQSGQEPEPQCLSGETCRATVQCAGRFSTPKELRQAMCHLEEGAGLCCSDVRGVLEENEQFNIQSTYRSPAAPGSKQKFPSNLTSAQIKKRIKKEKKNIKQIIEKRKLSSKVTQLHSFNKARASDGDIRESAITLFMLGELLSDTSVEGLDADNSQEVRDVCSWTREKWVDGGGRKPRCTEEDDSYRSVDGSCNNRDQPLYGMSGTPLKRILPPSYAGRDLPRVAHNGNQLPSGRKLSQNVFLSGDPKNTNGLTTLFMQMGQYIDHDLTHSPTSDGDCCIENSSNKSWIYPRDPYNNIPDQCFPIEVPADDPKWSGTGRRCMSLNRSNQSPPLDCRVGVREQMTALTHWLDASNIYGSTSKESAEVRDGLNRAFLLTTPREGGNLLPTCANPGVGRSSHGNEACENPICEDEKNKCFFSGDFRVNENPGLTIMHTVWTREHNRVARELLKTTSWGQERVYQQSRKIVIAQWQHIVYNEWLPLLLGPEFMAKFNLFPQTSGYSTDYDRNVDPRIYNEFAGAAFRFGHSMIPTKHPGKNAKGEDVTPVMDFKDALLRPALLIRPSFIENTIRGQSGEAAPAWDPVFVDDVMGDLFEYTDTDGGLDLMAINIQRARDWGVPGYNKYREKCAFNGYRQANSIDELSTSGFLSRGDVFKLTKAYEHVEDIDLFVGGTLEKRHKDSILGPAFKCIIGDQFKRLKRGDRFWYENGQDWQSRFLDSQLIEIRKTSMARILCDNTNIERVQPLVFRMEGGPVNNFAPCKDGLNIPRLDLDKFKVPDSVPAPIPEPPTVPPPVPAPTTVPAPVFAPTTVPAPVPPPGVSCGDHVAPSCATCPKGHTIGTTDPNGANYCHGDCQWDPARGCKIPDSVPAPIPEPPTVPPPAPTTVPAPFFLAPTTVPAPVPPPEVSFWRPHLETTTYSPPPAEPKTSSSVELKGGDGRMTGNVYITNSAGYKGPVCDDPNWGAFAAGIVCRQLGFAGGSATDNSKYGNVPEPFAMDNVNCVGGELRLEDCDYLSRADCGQTEAAGVECYK